MQINKSAYEKLIKEDIEWLLSNTKDSLERRHIVEVLNYSPERLYASDTSEIPNELEAAAEKHSGNYDSTIYYVLESSNQKTIWRREHKEVFIAGAQWQKEQMMKEAVELNVDDVGINYIDFNGFETDSLGINVGDKVKLIIIKEERK